MLVSNLPTSSWNPLIQIADENGIPFTCYLLPIATPQLRKSVSVSCHNPIERQLLLR
ncbi:hypothetical protein D3C78_1671390 [compost metagenome]